MKTLIPILILALSPAVSSAQERRAPRPQGPTVRIPQSTKSQGGNSRNTTAQNQFLDENITLQLKGDFQGFVPLDIALTGNGREFKTDVTTKPTKDESPPVIITFRAIVSLNPDKGYQVSYDLGARIAVTTSTFASRPGTPVSTNVEYRDLLLSGNAKLTEGQPLVISKLNGEALTLAISKARPEE